MNRSLRAITVLLIALVALPLAAGAASVPLLPATAGDLVPTAGPTAAAKEFSGPAVSQDPVRFSWATDATAELAPRPQPARGQHQRLAPRP